MSALAEPQVELSPTVSDEIRRTTCYMCACRCGINVHLRDGIVRYIEGNKAALLARPPHEAAQTSGAARVWRV